MSHIYIDGPRPRVYVCTYGELTVDWSTMMHICCGRNFRPFHSYVRGIEVESGKDDTTRLTIAVLIGPA